LKKLGGDLEAANSVTDTRLFNKELDRGKTLCTPCNRGPSVHARTGSGSRYLRSDLIRTRGQLTVHDQHLGGQVSETAGYNR
jgi:hypothetical protein